ncbi:MAG TPA: nitrate reductase molybdenum cofactor assembly chaperone [Bacillota bacterium]|nr:nitrate reductase molybdenum cofactor assembly chaperone [Bacillota bacterium]
MDKHRRIFKLASILLQYPEEWVQDQELQEEVSYIEHPQVKELFWRFIHYVNAKELEELGENYVSTFDFNEKTSLYLTYLLFGDGQERGAAFVKLKKEFDEAGLPIEDEELPDYLPVVLEFAALAKEEYARKLFLIHRKAIDLLHAELESIQNPYRWIVQGCILIIDSLLTEQKAS